MAEEMWTPPTVSTGKVPKVIPGRSGDQLIEGDFPLDQVVIDSKQFAISNVKNSTLTFQTFLQVHIYTHAIDMERLLGLSRQELRQPLQKLYFLKVWDTSRLPFSKTYPLSVCRGGSREGLLEGEFYSMSELYNQLRTLSQSP